MSAVVVEKVAHHENSARLVCKVTTCEVVDTEVPTAAVSTYAELLELGVRHTRETGHATDIYVIQGWSTRISTLNPEEHPA